MKIAIGSDHTGVDLKALIIKTFDDVDFMDFGPEAKESVDYPDYIEKVARAVQKGECERGIAICGTGIGASITANKVRGIRASLCFNGFMAEMTRKHNDSNVLVLGARVTGEEVALYIVEKWLYTGYEGGRHQRRLDKISSIENREIGGD
ncbi:MAG: ribose 5-phosphate isomerase B [Spirochaetes bacterium]|nr:ribose 5-phosphate isomerase B [Spirochaetota bacterium]MBN2770177.1 ribose 5-phosphate isomerase B [Spirochaetota bacterium]